jgi:hypothetical protein
MLLIASPESGQTRAPSQSVWDAGDGCGEHASIWRKPEASAEAPLIENRALETPGTGDA